MRRAGSLPRRRASSGSPRSLRPASAWGCRCPPSCSSAACSIWSSACSARAASSSSPLEKGTYLLAVHAPATRASPQVQARPRGARRRQGRSPRGVPARLLPADRSQPVKSVTPEPSPCSSLLAVFPARGRGLPPRGREPAPRGRLADPPRAVPARVRSGHRLLPRQRGPRQADRRRRREAAEDRALVARPVLLGRPPDAPVPPRRALARAGSASPSRPAARARCSRR